MSIASRALVKKPVTEFAPPALMAVITLLAAAFLMLQPPEAGPVAALFPPWWSATRSLVAASSAGAIVRFGAWPFVVVVDPSSADRLRKSGAWLILNPAAFGGCAGPRLDLKTS